MTKVYLFNERSSGVSSESSELSFPFFFFVSFVTISASRNSNQNRENQVQRSRSILCKNRHKCKNEIRLVQKECNIL